MAILITGGAGFIGSHLLDLLLEVCSEKLICVDNFSGLGGGHNVSPYAELSRFELVEADVRDTAAMAAVFDRWPVRKVIHLAALAGVRDSRHRPQAYQETNVGGTLALLEACKSREIERFVFASSSTVYGMAAPTPFTEDRPLGIPASPYGVTKRAAELMVLNYHHLYGLPAVILRPFSVYGSRMRNDLAISIFSERMDRGEPLTLYGDGSVRRDYTHVSDICAGFVAALWSDDLEGEAINLGHGAPIRMDEVITHLEQVLDTTAQVQHQPGSVADLNVTHASMTKAWQLLGYKPKIAFEDGIREYASWFKQRRFPRLAEETVRPGQTSPSSGSRAQAS